MLNSLPKVSIVIPVYNGADFLNEAIDSALAQTYPNIEILVINDGSNDDGATERIAQKFGNKIRYYPKSNGGVASALNFAIEKMNGEYFSWLSHDDLYLPQKIEIEMASIRHLPSERAIVYSDFAVFSDSPEKCTNIDLKHISPEQFRYWITTENSLHGCTLMVPRAAFTECGNFDESLRTTQDYDLWFRMAARYEFHHVPEVLVKARAHSGQGSVSMADLAAIECDQLLTKFVSELTAIEVAQGCRRATVVGYALVAESMWRRGFRKAGRRSRHLALRALVTASVVDRMAALSIIVKGRTLIVIYSNLIRPVLKKVVPTSVVQIARKWIKRPPAEVISGSNVRRADVDKVKHLALKEKFSEVYEKNIFGGPESRSGAGSDLIQTAIIRRELPRIIGQYQIKSMLDAPCGDWLWMREVDLNLDRYIGVDIVEALINQNKAEFGRVGMDFQTLDLSKDTLPNVDLIFSRDCLVHLSYSDALRIVKNFRASGAKYLLTTTFTERTSNIDLGDGFWRPLNMQLAPFGFPTPLEIINEGCTEDDHKFTDKSLGLWRLQDIKSE